MLILIMLCYKPELIKTLKHWNLRCRENIRIAEPEKWPRNQDNLFYDIWHLKSAMKEYYSLMISRKLDNHWNKN